MCIRDRLRTITRDINEQNNEIKSNFSEKLNEIRDKIKQQNFDFNKHIKEINTCLNTVKEPVSYTHLDVYKRQMYNEIQCPLTYQHITVS